MSDAFPGCTPECESLTLGKGLTHPSQYGWVTGTAFCDASEIIGARELGEYLQIAYTSATTLHHMYASTMRLIVNGSLFSKMRLADSLYISLAIEVWASKQLEYGLTKLTGNKKQVTYIQCNIYSDITHPISPHHST